MPLSERAEEILEILWTNFEDSGVESLQVDSLPETGKAEALSELQGSKLVEILDGNISLTDRGEPEARDIVRRHRLAERLMADVLDVSGDQREESACQFEHLLRRGLDQKLCTLLGHPRTCPHGKPIPLGECCVEAARTGERYIVRLSDLSPNQMGTIAYLQVTKSKQLQKLMSMGVLPGASVKLIRRFPSYVFQVSYTQYAVDSETADQIYVRLDISQEESRKANSTKTGRHRGRFGFPRIFGRSG